MAGPPGGSSSSGPSHDIDLLSHRAEIFRSKLIEDFHLLDSISDKGRVEIPKFYSKDVPDKEKRKSMMKEGPHGLVRFQVYSDKEKLLLTTNDRRKNRVKIKMSKYPPLDMWAHWVVESTFFQNCILALILTNCVVLGIQAEVNDLHGPDWETPKMVLNIFDYVTLFIFLLEILLKWLDEFGSFWKNGWNIFDFFVTFLSLVPEILKYSPGGDGEATSDLTVIADNLRVFRVLRSLKMVTRFRQVRLIALAVAKAFQAMLFISMLFLTFAYIFAIAGVVFFDNYSNCSRTDLLYKDSFATIMSALITLFQLFTLDHWHDILTDVTKVVNSWFAGIYIILWICIGSFIFRNIFVGIMVNNFQSIRNELFQEVVEIEDREQRNKEMADFAEELNRQGQIRRTASVISAERKAGMLDKNESIDTLAEMDAPVIVTGAAEEGFSEDTQTDNATPGITPEIQIATPMSEQETKKSREFSGMQQTSLHATQSHFMNREQLREAVSHHVVQATKSSADFQRKVEENLDNISLDQGTYCWPRDSLFRYFLLMEALMDNLKERQELLNLACISLLQIHDN